MSEGVAVATFSLVNKQSFGMSFLNLNQLDIS